MKVWVFVEGQSDRIALEALWAKWRENLRGKGWGIQIIPLENKSKYFRKIGAHAAEKLANNDQDLAVGLPDLYPNREYEGTPFKHANLNELKAVQTGLVKDSLEAIYGIRAAKLQDALNRFCPTALKHELEMLLLAAHEELRAFLGTRDTLGSWRHPVEDQNQIKPPKDIVADLFRLKKGRRYRDTTDAQGVLQRVRDIKNILYGTSGQIECPVFKEMLDWIGVRTGVGAYQ